MKNQRKVAAFLAYNQKVKNEKIFNPHTFVCSACQSPILIHDDMNTGGSVAVLVGVHKVKSRF